jgi:hypothetical protein
MLTPEQIERDRADLHIPPDAWALLPDYMRNSVALWLLYGIVPGDFLTAVLCNDLREACLRADDTNKHKLFDYVRFFYNQTPVDCWGGPLSFEAWRLQGGLKHYRRELT